MTPSRAGRPWHAGGTPEAERWRATEPGRLFGNRTCNEDRLIEGQSRGSFDVATAMQFPSRELPRRFEFHPPVTIIDGQNVRCQFRKAKNPDNFHTEVPVEVGKIQSHNLLGNKIVLGNGEMHGR